MQETQLGSVAGKLEEQLKSETTHLAAMLGVISIALAVIIGSTVDDVNENCLLSRHTFCFDEFKQGLFSHWVQFIVASSHVMRM